MRGVWLLDKSGNALAAKTLHRYGFGVAAGDDHSHVRAYLFEMNESAFAPHGRHIHVEKHQRYFACLVPEQLDALETAVGEDYLESMVFQRGLGRSPYQCFIIHHQNGAVAAWTSR